MQEPGLPRPRTAPPIARPPATPSRGSHPTRERPRVVVIGGGIAGLTAARCLAAQDMAVTILEAGDRLGGCVRTVSFEGARIDVGAEAVHRAAPGPLELVAALGLEADLVEAAVAPTWIATARGVRRLPDGVGPAGPTRVGPLVTSGLLSPLALARAACEPFVPSITTREDRSVGEVVGRRFGRQVVDRIVDPLLGGLHAGDVDRLSLRAATPPLAALLEEHRSVVLAGRHRRGAGGPAGFLTLRGGLERLVDAAADSLPGDVRLLVAAQAVLDTGRSDGRWLVATDAGMVAADAVVLATPARAAMPLLAQVAPGTSAILGSIRFASVAVALFSYPESARDLVRGGGVLLPSGSGRLLKSATFVSTRWPHLAPGRLLVRASAGRIDDLRAHGLDDDELARRLADDLADVAGLPTPPLDRRVIRWHRAMPQLEVGHTARVASARAQLPPGLALAGASYDGVGLAAAMRSGTSAATQVLAHLTGAAA